MNKPWFLRSKKIGDYSHLRRKEFNELRETVSDAVREHADSSWKMIKTAALVALADLAEKHRCKVQFNREGGHICFYKHKVPVFALRIGNYSRHRVEDLLRGKALYRGIVDIVPSTLVPLPKDLSPGAREYALQHREMMQKLKSLKVLYFLLPTIKAGKWKNKEAFDMVDVIECIKAHPGSTRSDIQHTLNLSPNKTVRLLHWLSRRQILRHRGSDRNSGWYLN